MEWVRAFVAIRIEEPLLSAILRLQQRLIRCGADVAWVSPINLHLTLRFLGALSPDQVRQAALAVAECARNESPFPIRVGGLGIFHNEQGRPRVIWVGVRSGAETLAALAARLDAALGDRGFAAETRPFRAHVTLGRVRSLERFSLLAQQLGDPALAAPLGEMRVSRIHLMKSTLTRQGPIYAPLAVHPLGGSGGAGKGAVPSHE